MLRTNIFSRQYSRASRTAETSPCPRIHGGSTDDIRSIPEYSWCSVSYTTIVSTFARFHALMKDVFMGTYKFRSSVAGAGCVQIFVAILHFSWK